MARLAKASKTYHGKQHKAGAGHGNGNGTATGQLRGVGGSFAVPNHRRHLLATTAGAAAAAAAGTAGAFQSALAAAGAAGAAAASTASAAVAAAGTSLATAVHGSGGWGATAPVASIVDHYHSRVFLWHKVRYTST